MALRDVGKLVFLIFEIGLIVPLCCFFHLRKDEIGASCKGPGLEWDPRSRC